MNKIKVDVLLGLQWGDEGKGKIVDVFTPRYDIIARFQGGPNAGHTLEFNGIKHVLRTIPSGIFRENSVNIIGNGVVIDPVVVMGEIDALIKMGVDVKSKLLFAKKAHLILPTHRLLDAASEASKGNDKIGSTLKGIGPTYMDKTGRNGIRMGDMMLPGFKEKYEALREKHKQILSHHNFTYDLPPMEAEWCEAIERLKAFKQIDSEHYVNEAMKAGKSILAEGAQGSLLDIDFGSYPFVTSSNTICAGACTGLGVAPNRIGNVYGIFKAYCTRVGSGPFPTELFDDAGQGIRDRGNEYGSVTKRPRRTGWLDLPALKYAVMINGVTELLMMKADILSGLDTIKVCTAYNYQGQHIDHLPFDYSPELLTPVYTELKGWTQDLTGLNQLEQLPAELHGYVEFIEKFIGVPVSVISVGPDRTQTLMRQPAAV